MAPRRPAAKPHLVYSSVRKPDDRDALLTGSTPGTEDDVMARFRSQQSRFGFASNGNAANRLPDH
ncbi:hypothetical protein [Bauldia litoralis]|nr:hypothetical protein [Bauldia litoralis]